jgi:hypothetical protein
MSFTETISFASNQPQPFYADQFGSENNLTIKDNESDNLDMLEDVKKNFVKNDFMSKYENILTKTADPIIKMENIKLSTAIIMKTLQKYFNVNDNDDETQINQLLSNVINENFELGLYMEKIDELNNPSKYDDDNNDDDDDDNNDDDDDDDDDDNNDDDDDDDDSIDNMLKDMGIESTKSKPKTNKIVEELRKIREDKAHKQITTKLNDLLKLREKTIEDSFNTPNTEELDRIFKQMTKSNKLSNLKGIERDDESNEIGVNNKIEHESKWTDISSMFEQYNISPAVIDLLTNMNKFKKELNDTHNKFISIQNTIDTFNGTIVSQLDWLKTMPNCLDGDIITKNIEATIQNRFDKEDIISLFKEYKNVYMKLMLLVSFAPREFIVGNGGNDNGCAICLNADKNIVLVPCGHTCCSECSNSLSSCMVCRAKIDKKQKIFNC